MVIAALGVLSVSIGYKYFRKFEFSSETAYDQLLGDIRWLQLVTMGSLERKSIQFSPGSGEYVVNGEKKKLPEGTTVQSTTLPQNCLVFNTIGEPDFPDFDDRFIYLSGGKFIKVYAITGKTE